jgi:hypothetical protein
MALADRSDVLWHTTILSEKGNNLRDPEDAELTDRMIARMGIGKDPASALSTCFWPSVLATGCSSRLHPRASRDDNGGNVEVTEDTKKRLRPGERRDQGN